MEVVEQAHRAGVPMAYGTDLIGAHAPPCRTRSSSCAPISFRRPI